jgi:hypothetical protein
MRTHRLTRGPAIVALGACLLLLSTARVHAVTGGQTPHLTDGIVTPGEWPTPTSAQQFFTFNPATGAGGAYLSVDQGSALGGSPNGSLGTNLYLLYDYVQATSAPTPSTFFDVFFQVAPEQTDYLVRIQGTTFTAYEKPDGVTAPTPGGSFDPTQAPWTPLTASDLALANFSAAIGFGPSPNAATPHQVAEFQLSINSAGSSGPGNGIYDPSPAFWSASTGASNVADPPISSGIFTLNPDGTTVVVPVLGANGDPILQPGGTVPEPSSLVLAGLAVAVGFGCRLAGGRRKRKA